MGIDKFNLTIDKTVDVSYLKEFGTVTEDSHRIRLYKYFCKMDYAEVMWRPHKFSEQTNFRIPYCKVDINPKYFKSFNALCDYLVGIFGDIKIYLNEFNLSRIDVFSDIEYLPIDVVLSRLYAMGYRRDSVSIYKGSTIYIGSSPNIRIYDKIKEIKARIAKGLDVTDYEKEIVNSGKEITRVEVQIRHPKKTLKDVADNPISLVSYFDRIGFYNFEDNEIIASLGGLQILMSKIRREHRKALETFKTESLKELLRGNFIKSITAFFTSENNLNADDVPF